MMTVEQIVKAVLSGEKTALAITQEALAVIAEKNPSVNAFVEVFCVMQILSLLGF